MITEAVLTAIVNGILGIVGGLINGALNAVPNPIPSYQFQIPSPFWFIVAFVLGYVAVIYPLLLAYWAWRQVKA